VRDAQRVAAILLRATLWTGALLVIIAGMLDFGRGTWAVWGFWIAHVGIGVVIAGPFLTLIAIAASARRPSVTVYAMITIAIALAGAILAT
jgi:hypothetical protein